MTNTRVYRLDSETMLAVYVGVVIATTAVFTGEIRFAATTKSNSTINRPVIFFT